MISRASRSASSLVRPRPSSRNVRVSVARDNGSACVLVADDGVGGADPADGSGLRGLADELLVNEGYLLTKNRSGHFVNPEIVAGRVGSLRPPRGTVPSAQWAPRLRTFWLSH